MVSKGMTYEMPVPPRRIVCLTEEFTEILYLLGEEERIVGISAYAVRPPRAKKEKPVVSAFIGGSVDKIVALKPDLILGFSDIQAQLAKDLIAANQQVLIFNQRTVQDILDVIATVGRIVGTQEKAEGLVDSCLKNIAATRTRSAGKGVRVYFEEWDEPMISGIAWISELISIIGGVDVFAHKAAGKLAKERIVTAQDVVFADPDVYIASWCGKPFNKEALNKRPGWDKIKAVQTGKIFEMDPSIILQPGPACLTDGLQELERLLSL